LFLHDGSADVIFSSNLLLLLFLLLFAVFVARISNLSPANDIKLIDYKQRRRRLRIEATAVTSKMQENENA
jgi:hypothetical protein